MDCLADICDNILVQLASFSTSIFDFAVCLHLSVSKQLNQTSYPVVQRLNDLFITYEVYNCYMNCKERV